MRHGYPPAGAGPAAAGDEGVYVRMEIELVPERPGDRDHTGAKALLLAGRHGHQLADGLPGRGAERAEELPMMHEVGEQELRDGEHPLGMADIRDHLVLQEGGELGGALGAAGWAEPAPFRNRSALTRLHVSDPVRLLHAGTAAPFPGEPVYAWTPGASRPDRATYSPQVPP